MEFVLNPEDAFGRMVLFTMLVLYIYEPERFFNSSVPSLILFFIDFMF